MNCERIRNYHKKFFKNQWLEKYQHENEPFLKPILERANYLLDNQIIFTDPMDMEACHTPYSLDEFKWNTSPNEDPEWIFMLSRQSFLLDLTIAYNITGDACYFQKWKELIFDFIHQNGVPTDDNPLSWRPIDVGIRLTNWLKSMTYVTNEELLPLDEQEILTQAIQQHLNFLKSSFVDKYFLSNWGVLSLTGIAVTVLFFPTLLTSEEEKWVWRTLQKQIALQFYEEGIHWEQSPLYQHQVIMSILYILQVAQYLEVKLPIDLRKQLQKPIIASYYGADQNDKLNAIHDSDSADFTYVYDIYRQMGFLPKRDIGGCGLIYIGANYLSSKVLGDSLPAIFYGKESGFVSIKNQDLYFTLFNGRHGSSHGHASNGSFTLSYKGEDIFIDSGRYTYTETKLRRELKEEAAHNTIQLKSSSGTKITGSWQYEKIVEPIFHQIREFNQAYFVECAWSGTDKREQLFLFNRQFIILKELPVVIIFDKFQLSQSDEVKTNFNLAENIELRMINDQLASLTLKHQTMQLWSDTGSFNCEQKLASHTYNQLYSHTRLVHEMLVSQKGTHLLMIDLESKVSFEPISVYQNRECTQTDLVKGLKIRSDDEIEYDVYFTPFDIVKGDKLFISEYGQYIYGNVVLFEKDGSSTRLK